MLTKYLLNLTYETARPIFIISQPIFFFCIHLTIFVFLQDYSEGINNNQLFYSEGNYSTYFDDLVNQRRQNEDLPNNQVAATLKKTKKRKLSSDSSSSYIIRRNGSRGRYLIKLNVFDVKDKDCENVRDVINDNNNACVSVQYVVRENYDEVMDITETLIKKISNNLNDADMF